MFNDDYREEQEWIAEGCPTPEDVKHTVGSAIYYAVVIGLGIAGLWNFLLHR